MSEHTDSSTDTSTEDDIDGFFTTARTAGRDEAVELPTDSYLNYVLPHDDPKLVEVRGMNYLDFAEDRYQAPFLQELLQYWNSLYREPFVGITTEGTARSDLYPLSDLAPSDADARRAAAGVLDVLDAGERGRYRYPVDAPEWRAWSNPEFVVHRVGVRLEDLTPAAVEAILDLARASLSSEGFDQLREAMALNGYLGELVDLPTIMNERSYFTALFGDPSGSQPWGWSLFGHHVAVNFVSVGGRQVVAPVFLGGEPALSDGRHPPLFATRERLGLQLASSLTDQQRRQAVVYRSVLDPAMPAGRVHPADERHLAGAFRDNRVIGYEGIAAVDLDEAQRSVLLSLVEDALGLLVQPQRQATLAAVETHLDDTYFCWYGATDGTQPFYFRVQSPVILTELDHHAGVWLTNRLPARFHVHTTLRLPNGNDYGRAYLDQWRSRNGGG